MKPSGPRRSEQALEVLPHPCSAGEHHVNVLPIYSQPSAFHQTPLVCVPAGEREGDFV